MSHSRPKRRGDCEVQERPCPWGSCRYHLCAEACSRADRLRLPEPEITDCAETCALDVAGR